MPDYPKLDRPRLREAGYAFVGPSGHSAVKVCHWARRSIRGEGECYKAAFYGISSHCCLQMSPATPFCSLLCRFCWRPNELYERDWTGPVDEPAVIVDQAIAAQRKLLNGFPGSPTTDKARWREAQDPAHAAISLAGEPALYPRLPELVKEFHSRRMSTFLVTNGTVPEMIERLDAEGALPTQLYVSLTAFDEQSYTLANVPLVEGAWRKYNQSLDLMRKLGGKTRTVLRMTLARGLNLSNAGDYAALVEKAMPHYVEAKAFMAVGAGRRKLGKEAMPSQEEVVAFAKELAAESGYLLSQEHVPSRVALLCRDEKTKAGRRIDFAKIDGRR